MKECFYKIAIRHSRNRFFQVKFNVEFTREAVNFSILLLVYIFPKKVTNLNIIICLSQLQELGLQTAYSGNDAVYRYIQNLWPSHSFLTMR